MALLVESGSAPTRRSRRSTDANAGADRGAFNTREDLLRALAELPDDVQYVFIHDCARPLVRAEQLERALRSAPEGTPDRAERALTHLEWNPLVEARQEFWAMLRDRGRSSGSRRRAR